MWKLISTEGWYRPRFTWSAVATRWLIRLQCGLNEFIVHFSMPGEGDSLCVLLHLEMNRCWLCVLEGMQTLTQRRVTCKTAGCYTSSRIGNQAFSSHSDLLRVYIVLSLPLVQNARAQWNESAAYLSSIWICMGGTIGDVRQLGLSLIIQHPVCSYWSLPQPWAFICVIWYFQNGNHC